MSKFPSWEDVRRELNFTQEEEEIRLETEIIEATIEAKKKRCNTGRTK